MLHHSLQRFIELAKSFNGLWVGWQHPVRWSRLHYSRGVHLQTVKVLSYCTYTMHVYAEMRLETETEARQKRYVAARRLSLSRRCM